MPPKKKTRLQLNKAALLESLDLTSPPSPTSLSQDQLLKANGLHNSQLERHPSKWTGSDHESADGHASGSDQGRAKGVSGAGVKEKELAEEGKVIEEGIDLTLDTTDDEMGAVQSMGSKATKTFGKQRSTTVAKGKGKAKDPCSAEACLTNPACLNHLGQQQWEDATKAMKAFRKAAGIGESPDNTREDLTVPVGLRNLGATCYMNSLIQVWNQNHEFRAGVYSCTVPPSASAVAGPSSFTANPSPLQCLQMIFGSLQTSTQKWISPDALTDALKLNTGEQQDAQEFAKLFMNLLDHEFKKQGGPAAKLIKNMFEGEIVYGIQCDTCKRKSERTSAFLELEINLKRNCKLEDQLERSVQDEHMDGDNQYKCESCGTMRDATRFTRIQRLPSVLHISLLRFVFSMKDLTRAKSTHAIAYPLKLDMGQFLPDPPPGADGKKVKKPECWYALKGVLIHRGTSAHHGHYVAQVHDVTNDKWFLFDDEAVSPIDDLNAPDETEVKVADTGSNGKGKAAATKPGRGFIRTARGEIMPNSKDAYMLVYTRIEEGEAAPRVPDPPRYVIEAVKALDIAHDIAVKEFQEKESSVKAEFESKRELKRKVYRHWDAEEGDAETFLVERAALKSWIEDGLAPAKRVVDKGDKTAPASTSVASARNPGSCDVSNVEFDAPKALEHVDSLNEHPNGMRSGSDTSIRASPHESIIPESPQSQKFETPPMSPLPPLASPNPPPDQEDADMIAVEAKSFKTLMIESSSVLCKHGNVDPAKADKVKILSPMALFAFHELGVQIAPELMTRSSLCRNCVGLAVADKAYEADHAEHVASFREANIADEGEDDVWVEQTFLNDWTSAIPRTHKSGDQVDAPPYSGTYGPGVFCEHSRLHANRKLRKRIRREAAVVLQSIWPDWEPISVEAEPCKRCANDLIATDEQDKQDKVDKDAEKKVLRSFTDQGKLIKGLTIVPGVQFAVPQGFRRDWLKWSKSHGGSRPIQLDNHHLLCHHGRVNFDIEQEKDQGHRVEVVNQKEWTFLLKNYNAGPPIKIIEDEERVKTHPAPCAECIQVRRMEYNLAQIYVKTLSKSDFESDGSRKIDSVSSPEAVFLASKNNRSGIETYGTRASKRLKEKPARELARKLFKLSIEQSDSVKDLKVKIDDAQRIPTLYQRLFYDGQELDNAATVKELGIGSGATIELFEVAVDDDADFSKLDHGPPLKKSRRNAPEQGFSGTGLTGWEDPADFEMNVDGNHDSNWSKSSGGSQLSFCDPLACLACTYVQSERRDTCEVCETPMSG